MQNRLSLLQSIKHIVGKKLSTIYAINVTRALSNHTQILEIVLEWVLVLVQLLIRFQNSRARTVRSLADFNKL